MNMNKYINRSSCFLVVCCRIGTEYIENHMPARCAFFRTRTESESLTIVHWRCLLRMEISSWNTEMTSVGFGGSVCRHHHRRPRDTTDDRWSLRWGSDPKGSIPLDLVEVSWKGWLVSDGIVWSKSLSSRCRDYDILYIYMYIYIHTHIIYFYICSLCPSCSGIMLGASKTTRCLAERIWRDVYCVWRTRWDWL